METGARQATCVAQTNLESNEIETILFRFLHLLFDFSRAAIVSGEVATATLSLIYSNVMRRRTFFGALHSLRCVALLAIWAYSIFGTLTNADLSSGYESLQTLFVWLRCAVKWNDLGKKEAKRGGWNHREKNPIRIRIWIRWLLLDS